MHGDGESAGTGNGAGVDRPVPRTDADRPVARTKVPSWPRRGLGTLLGCATALPGALYFLVVGTALGPFLLLPSTRSGAQGILMAYARRLVTVERVRRSAFFGDLFPAHYRASDRKVLRYLAVRASTGLLCAVVLALLVLGAVLAAILVYGAGRGRLDWDELLTQVLLGGVLLFLDVQGLYALAALDARTAREHFGPSEESCSGGASTNSPPAGRPSSRPWTPSGGASSAISTTGSSSGSWRSPC